MCDSCRCPSHACEDSLSKIAQSPAKARDCAKKVRQGRQAPEEAPRAARRPSTIVAISFPFRYKAPSPRYLVRATQRTASRPQPPTDSLRHAAAQPRLPVRCIGSAMLGTRSSICTLSLVPYGSSLSRPGHPKEQKEPARSGLSERSVRHVSLTCTATRACGRSRSAGEARGCGGRRHRSRWPGTTRRWNRSRSSS